MGLCTQHWETYRKRTLRGTLYAMVDLGIVVPTLALVGYLLEPLDDLRTALLIALAVAWLVLLVGIAVRYSRDRCRCHWSWRVHRFESETRDWGSNTAAQQCC